MQSGGQEDWGQEKGQHAAVESIGGPDSVRVGPEVQAARRDKAVGRKDDDGRFS